MPHRSPARFLAPAALIVAAVLVFLVTRPGPDAERAATPAPPAASTGSSAPASAKKPARRAARTYTVKAGDSLGTIAEETGVSQADLLDANDITDPAALSVGQKLKLSAP